MKPMATRVTATTSASKAAPPTYSGLPGAAIVTRAPWVSRAVRATGPVWTYGHDARTPAKSSGKAEAYRPWTAGRPASSA